MGEGFIMDVIWGIVLIIVILVIMESVKFILNALLFIITSPIWISQIIYDKIKGCDREVFDPDTLDNF